MSSSLSGGLVPLGNRSGSGSAESNTLSGGLIPLAGKGVSKSSTTTGSRTSTSTSLGRLGFRSPLADNDSGSDRDKEHKDMGGKVTEVSSSVKEKKSKRGSSSRKRDKGRSKEGRSRSKDESRGDSGISESRQNRSSSFLAEPDDDDDYLFMGATAGAKGGRKSGSGMAEATALLLGDSGDSFNFGASTKLKKSRSRDADKTEVDFQTSEENNSSMDAAGSSAKAVTRNKDVLKLGVRQGGGRTRLSGAREHAVEGSETPAQDSPAKGRPTSASKRGPTTTATKFDHDDKNSFDEADMLLRMTDPDALADAATGHRTTEPLNATVLPSDEASTQQGGSRKSSFRTLSSSLDVDTKSSPHDATIGIDDVVAESGGSAPQRRSPSPPSRARKEGSESPDMSPRRVHETLSRSGSRDALDSAADLTAEGIEREGRTRKATRYDEVAINPQRDEVGQTSKIVHSDGGNVINATNRGGVASVTGSIPLRSALAGADKRRVGGAKYRGVSFDDDLDNVNALDILPSSDDDSPAADPTASLRPDLASSHAVAQLESPSFFASTAGAPAIPLADLGTTPATSANDPDRDSSVRDGTSKQLYIQREVGRVSAATRESPSKSSADAVVFRNIEGPTNSLTAGLSPAAALKMAEDSSLSGDEGKRIGKNPKNTDLDSRLGLRTTAMMPAEDGNRSTDAIPSSTTGSIDDDAKLDIALGFTPSAMDGGRRQRRILPAGGRRRPHTTDPPKMRGQDPMFPAPTGSSQVLLPVDVTPPQGPSADDMRTASIPPLASTPSKSTFMAEGKAKNPGRSDDADKQMKIIAATFPSHTAKDAHETTPPVRQESALNSRRDAEGTCDGTAKPDSSRHKSKKNSARSSGGGGQVDSSVLSSLERQLFLLTDDREAAAARFLREEEKLRREVEEARAATVAAETSARDGDSALAAARARIRQLEAEVAGEKSALAAVESKAASDLRAEQTSSMTKMSDEEIRHQAEARESERRHQEALLELKHLHREELEDVRRRTADSQTLETLASQVQASAGALKLLQGEMLERKAAAEVSREGQMDLRERLIQELEGSAKRAQQTAEDEVQRLQGTLMAMDQVMRGLRGQNAGERERLRQEHLRLEALQGSIVAEVEAMRKGVEDERKRLAERRAVLDAEKRQAEALTRVESDRLTEERLKLNTEREKFASIQVSASRAAEATARRQAEEEQRLNLARQSLEQEAMSLEARLTMARADLRKAEEVRATLDRVRDHDEMERRRLKSMAAELERAFDDVRIRGEEIEKRRLEAENARFQAVESAREATKEKEFLRRRSAQVEEAARWQDQERSSIAQARAQSATELSASRRLKSELARAMAVHRNQRQRGSQSIIPTAIRSSAPAQAALPPHDWLDFRGRSRENGPGMTSAMAKFTAESNSLRQSSPEDTSKNTQTSGPIRNTGIAAAEAMLQAAAAAPPPMALDVGKELTRLARRAADLRQCTSEQSVFLANVRAKTSFPYTSGPTAPEVMSPSPRVLTKAEPLALSPSEALDSVQQKWLPQSLLQSARINENADIKTFAADRRNSGPGNLGRQMEALRQAGEGGDMKMKGIGVDVRGTSDLGLSNSVLEEIDEIERACSNGASALEAEEAFVESLGRLGSPPVAV